MKLLSICIPNYNRIEKLERLIRESAAQIVEGGLHDNVQMCISDDCSPINPQSMIESVRKDFPSVEILFERFEQNQGMDYNFLNSALMADSEYCWIIGNDDIPVVGGIKKAVEILESNDVDIVLTPFDNCDEDSVRSTIFPLNIREKRIYNTEIKEEYEELIFSVDHNSGLFGFLSNVIFRREKWNEYKDLFKDKMNTIFIQIYMNVQTLEDGAKFLYMPDKIIRNFADDETNESIERICKMLFGLDGVVEFFFLDEHKKHLKRIMTDAYINGAIWDLEDGSSYKEKLKRVISPKNQLYKKYYIPIEDRKEILNRKNIIIYGAGNYGKKVYAELAKYNVNILGVADSDDSKRGIAFGSHFIISTNDMLEICRNEDVYVLVANHFGLETMVNYLLENKIEQIGIIS